MLKLTLRPGEYLDIGEDIRVIFSGGSANNIHLVVDAPRELNIARSSAAGRRDSSYYKERGISETAKKEIAAILKRERMQGKKEASARTAGRRETAGV